jgi:hypothetical protein
MNIYNKTTINKSRHKNTHNKKSKQIKFFDKLFFIPNNEKNQNKKENK